MTLVLSLRRPTRGMPGLLNISDVNFTQVKQRIGGQIQCALPSEGPPPCLQTPETLFLDVANASEIPCNVLYSIKAHPPVYNTYSSAEQRRILGRSPSRTSTYHFVWVRSALQGRRLLFLPDLDDVLMLHVPKNF